MSHASELECFLAILVRQIGTDRYPVGLLMDTLTSVHYIHSTWQNTSDLNVQRKFVLVHAMKAYGWCGVIAPLILNSALDGGES
jgi:hypothetical protein